MAPVYEVSRSPRENTRAKSTQRSRRESERERERSKSVPKRESDDIRDNNRRRLEAQYETDQSSDRDRRKSDNRRTSERIKAEGSRGIDHKTDNRRSLQYETDQSSDRDRRKSDNRRTSERIKAEGNRGIDHKTDSRRSFDRKSESHRHSERKNEYQGNERKNGNYRHRESRNDSYRSVKGSAKAVKEKSQSYQPPKLSPKTPKQDWSYYSESTEGTTSSEERSPPPAKVYLPKLNASQSFTDEESHLTVESGASDPRTPISSKYRRLRDSHDPEIRNPSPKHRARLNKWYDRRFPIVKHRSSSIDEELPNPQSLSSEEGLLGAADLPNITKAENGAMRTRQSIAFMAITVTVAQLFMLMLQITLCGTASWDINPMIGPYPDAFSLWGGKNAYLMLNENQWWRLVSPSFLHVGVLHFLANAFCQLEAIALFEREWGSFRWIIIYIISSVGCNSFSSYFDPDTISVGSSGALMGLYAAKLAQVCSAVFFDVTVSGIDDTIRLDHMSSVLCGLTIVSLLSSFTYIDWSGHMGGLVTGFLSGMFLFSYAIRSCCTWFFWSVMGLLGLAASLAAVIYFVVITGNPYDELGNPCEYFRSLFPEDYECGCMWQ